MIIPGSMDEAFLRHEGLVQQDGFKNQALTITTATDLLEVEEIIEQELRRPVSDKKYNHLKTPIRASIRVLKPTEDIQVANKSAEMLVSLLRLESTASKNDKRQSSRLSCTDTLSHETQRIDRRIKESGRALVSEPKLEEAVFTILNPKKWDFSKLDENSDDKASYLKVSPDPAFMQLKEMDEYIENPFDDASYVKLATQLDAVADFRSKSSESPDERWTEETEPHFHSNRMPPPFMNTYDGMKIDAPQKKIAEAKMNTQMVNHILFLPLAMAATHNENTDDDARISTTRYMLKYHLYPSLTQLPQLQKPYTMFYSKESSKTFFDDNMTDTTTAMFFSLMMNAVLTFDSSLNRFNRMCETLSKDEAQFGTKTFKKRLGETVMTLLWLVEPRTANSHIFHSFA